MVSPVSAPSSEAGSLGLSLVSAPTSEAGSSGLLELTSTPSRKRVRKPGLWQKSKRKRLRNSGQEYKTAASKTVSAYSMYALYLLIFLYW